MNSLTSADFKSEVVDSTTPSVVLFWAAWCGPCFNQEDAFKELKKAFPAVRFFKVNCDENHDIALDYNILTVPTTILFKNGKVVSRLAGMRDEEFLKEAIKKL